MAKRGGQPGNQNGAKGTDWQDALRKVLAQYENPDIKLERGQALRKIAETCVLQAIGGDKDARAEIANRLDGKPKEHVQVDQNISVNVGESESLEAAIRKRDPRAARPTVQ